RQPVAWTGPAPVRAEGPGADMFHDATGARRPVVAVLDSGAGEHPWLGEDTVVRDPHVLGQPISCVPAPSLPVEDPEIGGLSAPLTGPLDPVAGHGTFI